MSFYEVCEINKRYPDFSNGIDKYARAMACGKWEGTYSQRDYIMQEASSFVFAVFGLIWS
jgi:hypothetical protein